MTSASQQALYNDDILREVFECLSLRKFDRRSLAQCAVVCRAFSEPALDILWRDLDGLLPLLKVLSSFKQVGLRSEGRVLYVFCGNIPDTEWARFLKHGRRVRRLCEGPTHCQVDTSVFIDLAYHLAGRPLFPALESLCMERCLPGAELLLFMSHSLRSLEILGHDLLGTFDEENMIFGRSLQLLSCKAPLLQHLKFYGNVRPATLSCIGEFKHLQELEIHEFCRNYVVVSVEMLSACALLESLVMLSITLPPDANLSACRGFRTLRTLELHGNPSNVEGFLLGVISSSLESFKALHPSLKCSSREYRRCYTTLCSRFAASLRSISISHALYSHQGRRLKLLDIIRPLLGIHELEHVSLNARVPAMWALWTIEDIHDIAVAWPNLQELRLNYVIHAATIPISALSSFAQFCPRLQFLYMESIDFSLAPPSVYGSDAGNNHGLKQLWLPGDVASADLALLALYLDSLFPDLRSSSSQVLYLETGWRHPITYDNGWQKLMAVLSAVQTARYARSKGVSRCQRPLLPDISSAGHSKSNEDDVNILGRRRWLCFM